MKDSELFTYLKKKKDWKIISTKRHELNYFIEKKRNTLYLYFEDSNGTKDWKDNLNFFPVFAKGYKKYKSHLIVHIGFKKEYHSGNDQIMKELIDKIKKDDIKEVIISGWSNGAAMSTLAAEDLFFRTGIKPTVITFGCPKVCFDKKSAKYIKSCCKDFKEYCNNNDIVTKVPPIGRHINKIKVGDKFNLKKLFHPFEYHTNYDNNLKDINL